MDLEDLLDNIVIWFGYKITPEIYAVYLLTYIEVNRPEQTSMFVHKIVNRRRLTALFNQGLRNRKIQIVAAL